MVRKATGIENLMASLLRELDIKFKREYYIGNYPVDFYLPEYKLSIEVDGCFHHFCKKCNKGKKQYPRQVFQRRRDKACNLYHKHVGIRILRFFECELEDLSKIKKDILKALK